METLDISINNCLGTAAIEENDEDEGLFIEEPMVYEDLSDPNISNAEPIEEEALIPYVEYFESTDAYDQYILASVMIPKYDGFSRSLFTRQKQNLDRNIIGSCLSNPFLDTFIYESSILGWIYQQIRA